MMFVLCVFKVFDGDWEVENNKKDSCMHEVMYTITAYTYASTHNR